MTAPRINSYSRRNAMLRNLGYESYHAYLASPLWAGIRERVLSSRECKCSSCDSTLNLQVHHKRYTMENLTGRSLRKFTILCGKCHHDIEFSDGRKNTVSQAGKSLRNIHREKNTRMELRSSVGETLREGYANGNLLPDRLPSWL